MSEAPDLSESEALAAEHALGVLDARERAAAETRMATDPAFAADVEAWRERLAPMLGGVAAVPPTPELWRRIERLLPANDNGALMNRLKFWRNTAMGGFALAAASLAAVVVQVNQPPITIEKQVPVSPTGQLLSASVVSQEGSRGTRLEISPLIAPPAIHGSACAMERRINAATPATYGSGVKRVITSGTKRSATRFAPKPKRKPRRPAFS